MGGKLHFLISELEPIIFHTSQQKEFNPTLSQAYDARTMEKIPEHKLKIPPGLFFVKDEGAYLMSNSKERLYKWQVDKEFAKKMFLDCERRFKTDMADKSIWRNKLHKFATDKQLTPLEYCKKYHFCGTTNNAVAYAIGCNPNKNEDYYETSRLICGGSDFSEFISLVDVQKIIQSIKTRGNSKYLTIELDAESLKIY